MISTEKIFAVVRKELKGFFDSPTAYVILIAFVVLWEWLFFRSAFLAGEASLRAFVSLLPWLFVLLVPAITMGVFAQERREGTIEWLMTQPLRDIELLLGKWIGAWLFVTTALLWMFPVAFAFSQFGALDWGVVLGQFLAGVLLAAGLTAMGVFLSALMTSQVASLLLTALATLLVMVAGFEVVTLSLPPGIARYIESLSALTHFEAMARGVLDLRDVVYFVTIPVAWLSLTYWWIMRQRGMSRKKTQRLQIITIGIVVVVAVVNAIGGTIPGRLDLTEEKLYTLTPETKRVLAGLTEPITITLYSSELPAQMQQTLRDVNDILNDYEKFAGDNLVVERKRTVDSDVAIEAQTRGVQEVQFNVVGQEEFQVKKGFFGIVVAKSEEERDVIPFVQDATTLEYRLTSFIDQLTREERKVVGFLTGHGEKSSFAEYRFFTEELSRQFDVQNVARQGDIFTVPEDVDVLVIAGAKQEIPEDVQTAIFEFMNSGKSVLYLVESAEVGAQAFTATVTESNLDEIIAALGVSAGSELVYDFRSNDTIRFGQGVIGFVVPYPLWPRALAQGAGEEIFGSIESVLLAWASPLSVDSELLASQGYEAKALLKSTVAAGLLLVPEDSEGSGVPLTPDQNFSQENLAERTLAIALEKEVGSRVIIVGDADLFDDQYVQGSPENLAFGLAALSWLADEEGLSGIQAKQAVQRRLLFQGPTQIQAVRYGNLALAVLLPGGYGFWRLQRRKKLKRKGWKSA